MAVDFIKLEKKILNNNRPITRKDIEEELDNSHNQYNYGDFDQSDNEINNQINDQIKQYKKLHKLYSEKVFLLEEDEDFSIHLKEDFKAIAEYKLCLYTCGDNYSEKQRKKASKLFEQITGEAIKNYLGEGAAYKLIDRAEKINIEEICKNELKEKYHENAQKSFTNQNSPLRTDILAWKKLDHNKGKIICLIECKSGKNWKDKPPVNTDGWKGIIQFIAEPVKFFAITDLLEDEKDFLDRGKEKGIILDRTRILSLLVNLETEEIKKIRKEINDLNISIE